MCWSIIFTCFTAIAFAAGAKAEDTGGSLPAGIGREELTNNCQACHSLSYVTKTRRSAAGWEKTVTTMQKKNGMWALDNATRDRLLQYLNAQFSTETPGNSGLDEYSLLRPRLNPLAPAN